jgi:hypothetical protein
MEPIRLMTMSNDNKKNKSEKDMPETTAFSIEALKDAMDTKEIIERTICDPEVGITFESLILWWYLSKAAVC